MSGNSSRKYKRYMEMLERRRYFGDLPVRDEYGIVLLTAFGASRGVAICGTTKYDLSKVPKSKSKKRQNQ